MSGTGPVVTGGQPTGPASGEGPWNPNVPGQTPEQNYAAYLALPETEQESWRQTYGQLNPGTQQQWLEGTGQTDATGGYNNPGYQPWFNSQLEQGTTPGLDWQGAAPEDLYKQYTALPEQGRQAYINRYLGLDPEQQQSWLNAFGQQDATGGLNSPKYGEWFDQQLSIGRFPGLTQNQTPAQMYAQYQTLPQEVRDNYIRNYMKLSPADQMAWRQAFGQQAVDQGGVVPLGPEVPKRPVPLGPEVPKKRPELPMLPIGPRGSLSAALAGPGDYYSQLAAQDPRAGTVIPGTGGLMSEGRFWNNDPNSPYDWMNQPPSPPYVWGP